MQADLASQSDKLCMSFYTLCVSWPCAWNLGEAEDLPDLESEGDDAPHKYITFLTSCALLFFHSPTPTPQLIPLSPATSHSSSVTNMPLPALCTTHDISTTPPAHSNALTRPDLTQKAVAYSSRHRQICPGPIDSLHGTGT